MPTRASRSRPRSISARPEPILRVLTLAASLAALWPSAASAEERINRFTSDIATQKDGALDVTETIEVTAENAQINHGIFRDFPTRYRGPHGNIVHVGFELLGTTLDGENVASKTEGVAGGKRVRIGDSDHLVAIGAHRYTIHYRATRELGRFADHDELYWNVTGNGWIFPIDAAEVRVRLPSPARFGERAFFTGPQGATEQSAQVVSEQPGEIDIAATRALGARDGLTVALGIPKGVIAPEAASDRFWNWFADNGPTLVALLGLWALAFFYWMAWKRVGRDPDHGTMVPLFAPPDSLSPAALRYMLKEKVDARSMSASLVNLGVRGRLRLIKADGGFLSKDVTTVEGTGTTAPGPAEEDSLLTTLIGGATGSIVMKQEEHATFERAKKGLDEQLAERFDGKLFHRNWGWIGAGAGLFLAVLLLTAATAGLAAGAGGSSVAFGTALSVIFIALRGVGFVGGVLTRKNLLMVIGAVVLGLLAVLSGGPLIELAMATGNYWPFVPLLTAMPLVISSFWWMPSPTAEGQQLIDKILGFKHYLSVAEGPQLDRMNPPQATPALFEKYLPYAIALDVENRWATRFTAILAAAAAAPGARQGFLWYSGYGDPWSNVDGFTSDIGDGLTSTMSAASTAPESSSGLGGGGSSGGGGGGGGGGGW